MLKIDGGTAVSWLWSTCRLCRFAVLESSSDASWFSLSARNVAAVTRALKLRSAFLQIVLQGDTMDRIVG